MSYQSSIFIVTLKGTALVPLTQGLSALPGLCLTPSLSGKLQQIWYLKNLCMRAHNKS